MKWPYFVAVTLAVVELAAAAPASAGATVTPLGRTGTSNVPVLQLVQLKTSRDADILDLAFWNAIEQSSNPADYQAYLEAFPKGAFAPLARLRLAPVAETKGDEVEEVDLIYEVLLNANIRAAPRASSRRVGGLLEGTRIAVTGHAAGGTWLQVELQDGTRGFLFAELARQSEGRPAELASADPSVSTAAPAAEPKIAALPPTAPVSEPLPAEGFRDCPECPEMMPIKAGRFIMGDDGGDKSERPAHTVSLTRDFAIGRFEVTVAQWQTCVSAGGCPTLPGFDEFDANSPVRNVSWDDAQLYIDWLSQITGQAYRLPSEAEWEFAARGGTAARFWWGEDVAVGKVSCRQCGGEWSRESPLLVGSLDANPFGLFDVSGGVAEWTGDCWRSNHDGASADGSVVAKKNCRQRVLRGGSWRSSSPKFLASSSRFFYDADVRFVANGFRVARN